MIRHRGSAVRSINGVKTTHMKKFYSLLVAAAMVMGATSCQQDAIEEVATNEPVSFTATLNSTRTELGENDKVMWNADDKIRIYTQENTAGVVFDGDATEATTVAKFTTSEEFAASTTGYLAVYPELKYYYDAGAADNRSMAATASYANDVWSVPVHISEFQEPAAGAWDERFNIMAAYTTNNKLAFKACTALLEFTWTGTSNPMGGVTFTATGANLAGEGTLNYSTTDGQISVTTNGTETYISLMGIENGQTYYIPLFPGKVTGFKLSAYNSSWMMEDYISYEGEFEFKAGIIYSKKAGDEPVVTPSPYQLISGDMESQFPMVIENGYHVAKGIWYSDKGFCFFDGENALTATTDVVPGEWQATKNGWTEDYALIPFFTNCDQADIYLSEDASMMCVVPAGAEVPAMPGRTIYFYNADNWADVYFYSWDANDAHHTGDWPGTAMTKKMVGEVEYYAITLPNELNDTALNFIFNNNASTQTGDLSATLTEDLYFLPNGKQVEDIANPVPPVSYKIYAYNYAGWSTLNFYAWGAYTNTWPGDTLTETEVINGYTYYVKTLPATATGGSLQMIFNNGNGTQTADSEAVTVDKDIYVRVNVGSVTFLDDPNNPEPEVVPTDYKIYVKNSAGWSKMYIYAWGGLSTDSWPGAAMTTEVINGTTYYVHEFVGAGAVSGASIIFNNGSGSQTNDITNVNLTEDLFYEVSGTGSNYKKIADPRQ